MENKKKRKEKQVSGLSEVLELSQSIKFHFLVFNRNFAR